MNEPALHHDFWNYEGGKKRQVGIFETKALNEWIK